LADKYWVWKDLIKNKMNLKKKLEKYYFKLVGLLFLITLIVSFSCKYSKTIKENKAITSIKEYRKVRSSKLNQYRPVIHNNDGCDAYVYPLKYKNLIYGKENQPKQVNSDSLELDFEFSIQNFINIRSAGFIGSDVSTISYCSLASSFGQFTHNTKVGEFLTLSYQRPGSRNAVPEFVKLGTDPLEVTEKFAHENGFEFFWSNRINDTHDDVHRPDKPFERWSKLKTEHPEFLFGTPGEKLPYGRWSSVDFTHPEIRDLCVQYYTEVCENYDVDGIELDFFRHLCLFKNVAMGEVATTEQLDMLTNMLKQIREMTETVGMRKGKPILILIRVPDSFEYCRGVGIDLEKWMNKRLVDIVVGIGYLRFNPLRYLVEQGHKYDVKVYAGLGELRVRLKHPLLQLYNAGYRARAAASWQAGVDGLYIFNEFNTRSIYLSQIGSVNKLTDKNNLYFASYFSTDPNRFLKGGTNYSNLPLLHPSNPVILDSKPVELLVEIGDERLPAKIALFLHSQGTNSEATKVNLNGILLKYKKSTNDGLSAFEIPPEAVKPGENKLILNREPVQNALTLMDIAILFYRNPDDPDTNKLAALCF